MTILGANDEGKLRALLDSLGYDLEPSILIGGWATNARVGGEISHDIDLIITDQSLRQKLPERLTGYSENQLHSGGKKARGDADGVHVDAYFPYESKLGSKLLLDVGALARYIDPDFTVGVVEAVRTDPLEHRSGSRVVVGGRQPGGDHFRLGGR